MHLSVLYLKDLLFIVCNKMSPLLLHNKNLYIEQLRLTDLNTPMCRNLWRNALSVTKNIHLKKNVKKVPEAQTDYLTKNNRKLLKTRKFREISDTISQMYPAKHRPQSLEGPCAGSAPSSLMLLVTNIENISTFHSSLPDLPPLQMPPSFSLLPSLNSI